MNISEAKMKILEASLELFSKYGYEATSISQIADALGVKKASLYSHFASKQEIYDTLVDALDEYYEKNSLFSKAQIEALLDKDEINYSVEYQVEKVKSQIKFLLNDKRVRQARKLLTIEQFMNNKARDMQEIRSYQDILYFYTKVMERLIKIGVIVDEDPQCLALEYISPISMELYRVDRNEELLDEALEKIEKHIVLFNRVYIRDRKDRGIEK